MTTPSSIKLSRSDRELVLTTEAWTTIAERITHLYGSADWNPLPPLAFGPTCRVLDDEALDIADACYDLLCAMVDAGGAAVQELVDEDDPSPLVDLTGFASHGGIVAGAGFLIETVRP